IAAWTLDTLCGGVASGLLPQAVRDALGIMIYGMFLAIILPPCRKSKQITAVVACASLLSCLSALLQAYVPISSGFVIIICTVAAASLGAWLFPVQEENT
ncbi:MAG: branched-chain amino acid ABC transporter permease, partial [Merdibacter sp.]|nr:branched-chain amino acid ABC transporter permease [Merdibacter sp.]